MTKEELLTQIGKLQRRWEYHAVEHRAKRDTNHPNYDAYQHGMATGYLKALNTFKDWATRLVSDGELEWCSVNNSLPEIDEEVIVLTDELGTEPIYNICFGHIVDRRYAMDFNGWNIPGVKFWMPMPKIPEEKI